MEVKDDAVEVERNILCEEAKKLANLHYIRPSTIGQVADNLDGAMGNDFRHRWGFDARLNMAQELGIVDHDEYLALRMALSIHDKALKELQKALSCIDADGDAYAKELGNTMSAGK